MAKIVFFDTDLKRFGISLFHTNLLYAENTIASEFIALHVPLYALTSHVSIQKVTNSEEMAPWTLHNSYDRPIPRRICESNGVEKSAFGYDKHSAGISFSRNIIRKQMKNKMTIDGYNEFEQ